MAMIQSPPGTSKMTLAYDRLTLLAAGPPDVMFQNSVPIYTLTGNLVGYLSLLSHLFFIIVIEFIGVTLVNKIIYISGIQLYNTSTVCCICVHHPKSSLLPSPFISSLPSSTSPHPFPSSNLWL